MILSTCRSLIVIEAFRSGALCTCRLLEWDCAVTSAHRWSFIHPLLNKINRYFSFLIILTMSPMYFHAERPSFYEQRLKVQLWNHLNITISLSRYPRRVHMDDACWAENRNLTWRKRHSLSTATAETAPSRPLEPLLCDCVVSCRQIEIFLCGDILIDTANEQYPL